MPPEAVDLNDFVANLTNKNISKGMVDIAKWNQEGTRRLKWAQTLCPANDDTCVKDLDEDRV